MRTQKQMFGFGKPIKDILALCASDAVHVFWKDKESRFLGCNDIQARLIQTNFGSVDFIGRDCMDLCVPKEALMLMTNDGEVVKNSNIKLFAESFYGRECLSLKSQLKDSANNIIGTFGAAFYFDEIALAKAVSVINRLNFLSQQQLSSVMRCVIANNSNYLLSKREKECVYYILRGMSAKEIGKVLNISHRTVETHIEHIKSKLSCQTRSQVVNKILGELSML